MLRSAADRLETPKHIRAPGMYRKTRHKKVYDSLPQLVERLPDCKPLELIEMSPFWANSVFIQPLARRLAALPSRRRW